MIDHEDTGGSAPVVVLLHGLAMDGSVWRRIVADLRAGRRCVVPALPLGSHRRPLRPDADRSMGGHARIVAEFPERLDLRDVTLAGVDWGVAQVVAGGDGSERIGGWCWPHRRRSTTSRWGCPAGCWCSPRSCRAV